MTNIKYESIEEELTSRSIGAIRAVFNSEINSLYGSKIRVTYTILY